MACGGDVRANGGEEEAERGCIMELNKRVFFFGRISIIPPCHVLIF